jgi:hypothetical protein
MGGNVIKLIIFKTVVVFAIRVLRADIGKVEFLQVGSSEVQVFEHLGAWEVKVKGIPSIAAIGSGLIEWCKRNSSFVPSSKLEVEKKPMQSF